MHFGIVSGDSFGFLLLHPSPLKIASDIIVVLLGNTNSLVLKALAQRHVESLRVGQANFRSSQCCK